MDRLLGARLSPQWSRFFSHGYRTHVLDRGGYRCEDLSSKRILSGGRADAGLGTILIVASRQRGEDDRDRPGSGGCSSDAAGVPSTIWVVVRIGVDTSFSDSGPWVRECKCRRNRRTNMSFGPRVSQL